MPYGHHHKHKFIYSLSNNSIIFSPTSRNAEHEVAGMQDHYQEEISAKENLGRSLNKALGEADMLRVRYEKEGVAKAEELEMAKLKMQVAKSHDYKNKQI